MERAAMILNDAQRTSLGITLDRLEALLIEARTILHRDDASAGLTPETLDHVSSGDISTQNRGLKSRLNRA
jgi:hypothetical protein